MSPNTSRFGFMPNLDECKQHLNNFNAEMFRFTNDNGGLYRHVNILHLAIDLKETQCETNRIVEFMNQNGFRATQELNPKSFNDADIVMIGSDFSHSNDAKNAVRFVALGLNGLMPYWDVLWYGTDYTPNGYPPSVTTPLCVGNAFSIDGIFIARAHIRRRQDFMVLRGIYVSLFLEIEERIDKMLGTSGERLTDKIKKLKQKIKSDGREGLDADLFFAALDILRHSRHISSHTLGSKSNSKPTNKDLLWNSTTQFDSLAKKYDRRLRPPEFVSYDLPDFHTIMKWRFSMARAAYLWITEYQVIAKNPNASRQIESS